MLDILDEVSNGEVGRIALAVVSVFLAELEGALVGHGEGLHLVTEAGERRMDELFVLPGEPAKKDGGFAALLLGKRALNRLVEVRDFLGLNACLGFHPTSRIF